MHSKSLYVIGPRYSFTPLSPTARLRHVSNMNPQAPRPWTGSLTGASDNPSVVSVVSATMRVICAGRTIGARDRTSRKRQVTRWVIVGRRGQEVFRAGTEVFAQV